MYTNASAVVLLIAIGFFDICVAYWFQNYYNFFHQKYTDKFQNYNIHFRRQIIDSAFYSNIQKATIHKNSNNVCKSISDYDTMDKNENCWYNSDVDMSVVSEFIFSNYIYLFLFFLFA